MKARNGLYGCSLSFDSQICGKRGLWNVCVEFWKNIKSAVFLHWKSSKKVMDSKQHCLNFYIEKEFLKWTAVVNIVYCSPFGLLGSEAPVSKLYESSEVWCGEI